MIGKTISQYKILEKIGSGGMGAVYKAQDTKLDRFVALKFLAPQLSGTEEEKKRFVHEAKAASALDHSNICTVHEINETDEGQMYIAMAFYDGESLKAKINRGPLSIEETLDIAIQIASGLEKAHKKEIIHRDIKPANILLTEDNQIKILDFGLAKLAGQTKMTKTGTTLGTVAYMSPEQTQGTDVEHRSDIWSLGVIMYEMLTGKLPFEGEYDQAVVYSILNEAPEPVTKLNPALPDFLEQIVNKALEKKREKRYQHVGELLDDLKSISEGIVPKAIQTRVRKAQLRKSKKVVLYTVSLVLLIAAITVVSFLVRRSQTIDSVAVLPLKNLTGYTDLEYFVDGVTDELIGQLGQISGLKRVISRTSVMQYKETEKTLSDIARELNVDAVVEGTVYQAGDSVRIRIQLIDVYPEERNLWGYTYKRSKTDVLILYRDVTRALANEIKIGLTAEEETHLASAYQINPEAYEAYLKGMSHWYKLTPIELETARQYFELALSKDPDYALAHTGIAFAWIGLQQMGAVEASEATPKAKAAAQIALELDETLAEVHYTWALIKTWSDWDWEGGETAFLKALELKPNYPDAMVYYSNLLCYLARTDEALEYAERAVELDPLNSQYLGLSGSVLHYIRHYDEAIGRYQDVLKTSPYDPVGNQGLQESYHMKGMYEEAIGAASTFFTGLGLTDLVKVMTIAYEEKGYSGAMNLVGDSMTEFSKEVYISPFFIAYSYVFAGNKERALECLEKAYKLGDPMMPYIIWPSFFDLLRYEPRYQDLLHKLKFPVVKTK